MTMNPLHILNIPIDDKHQKEKERGMVIIVHDV